MRLVSALLAATLGAACRNSREQLRLAFLSRLALLQSATVAACNSGYAMACLALEHHEPDRAGAVRGRTHDLQVLGTEHLIRQRVGTAVRARWGQR